MQNKSSSVKTNEMNTVLLINFIDQLTDFSGQDPLIAQTQKEC